MDREGEGVKERERESESEIKTLIERSVRNTHHGPHAREPRPHRPGPVRALAIQPRVKSLRSSYTGLYRQRAKREQVKRFKDFHLKSKARICRICAIFS